MIDVQQLADLARMAVPNDEQESVGKDLVSIVGFVDRVQSRDASLASPDLERVNVFRDDIVLPLASAYDLAGAAPGNHDGFVKVPKIIG